MAELDVEAREQLAYVAHLYYEAGLTQANIAERVGVSRSSISRMLGEARKVGVLEIRIHYPTPRDSGLEDELLQRFNISTVYVLQNKHSLESQSLQQAGRLAARHIEDRLRPSMIFAVSWGTAVYETVNAIRRHNMPDAHVVQFIGALGFGNRRTDGPELAQQLGNTLGAEYMYLHSPLLVETRTIRDSLMTETSIAQTLAVAKEADLALVGIGTTNPTASSLIRAGYLRKSELQAIADQGAVGDICARHFDIDGNVLDIDINHQVVGISIEDLRNIPEVIGVAVGRVKAPAILGALRGEFVDTLVTDAQAAREILHLCGITT